jgi:branched-chain amino acid transport system substrate-binding protein
MKRYFAIFYLCLASSFLLAEAKEPVYIGIDAEFKYKNSTSAQAIALGIEIAIDEINRKGGVLGGRPLKLIKKDNHSVPARSLANLKTFSQQKDLVAVFCGRFSPAVLEVLGEAHKLKIPLLDPWAAADGITSNKYSPNYAFRLSLRDSWAMPVMLDHGRSKGVNKVGLLLLNTSWGRGNLAVAEAYTKQSNELSIAGVSWFNWNDKSLLARFEELKSKGAQGIVIVANAKGAALLVNEMSTLPEDQRLPVFSHWGITGGNFPEMTGLNRNKIDFSVVQTYSFIDAQRPQATQVVAAVIKKTGVSSAREIKAPVGVAHAYDLTHILAKAIDIAGVTDREKIRDALEKVTDYDGLIKYYSKPFSASNHDALSIDNVFMAEYADDNAIVPVR